MTHTHKHGQRRFKNHTRFLIVFSSAFLFTFIFLYAFDLVPAELINGTPKSSPIDDLKIRILGNFDNTEKEIIQSNKTGVAEKPIYIDIPKVGVSILVQNPDSTSVSVLDQYLTKGVVRYPGSGVIGDGNMFIFGHNAEAYKNVKNAALKAFNGIENLVKGDEIYVKSEKGTYVYKVTSERLANAEEEFVDFSNNKNILTLSTCNTFGKKEQRYVVEAEYAGRQAE